MTRAIVFANGDCNDAICTLANISKKDFLVCVDGGLRHCLAAGLQPNLLVGDLDSLDKASADAINGQHIECVQFPTQKNASDLELTLRTLLDRSIEEVVLLGISGGRTDHVLFNWQLAASRSWPYRLRLIDDYVDAQVVDSSRPLSITAEAGQTFSVIPLIQNAKGVEIAGAAYPLTGADLPLGSTLGLSNEVVRPCLQVGDELVKPCLQVSVEQGILMVMMIHTAR